MTQETFFEKFDQFADAPDAVARMRELVLELAMRGRLTAQDETDEPASALLKRIWVEKARLYPRSTEIDGQQARPSGDDRFPIPANWRWTGAVTPAVVISDLGKKVQTKDVLESGKYPVVDQGRTFVRGFCNDFDKVIRVTEPIVLFGDHTRETKLIDFDFVVGADGVKLLKPICIDPKFYFLALRWLPLEERGYARHFKHLKSAQIPLPPYNEQKRIVVRVGELMALCDRLEALQEAREARHAALSSAAVSRFDEAPTPANLNFLFHNSYSIPPADLRKSILRLAVAGRLVSQDLNDESAEDLLTRIEEERRPLQTKVYPPVTSQEEPFEIPRSWMWTRLGNVALSSDSGWSPQCDAQPRQGTEWGVLKVSAVSWGEFLPDENKALPPDLNAREECEVKKGDFLLSRANTEDLVARSVIVTSTPPHLMMSDKIVRFTFPVFIEKKFINLVNSSDFARSYYARNASGTSSSMKNVSRDVMCNLPIPLPPLEEQRRIVAKVDTLFALTSQLETTLASSRLVSDELMSSVVAQIAFGENR